MSDPRLRELATGTWNAASRLFRLFDQWKSWYWSLRRTGDADGGFAIRLRWASETCIRILCDTGLGFGTADELLLFVPRLPLFLLDPPWQQDITWLEPARLTLGASTSLQGYLDDFLRRLAEAPGFIFADHAGGSIPSPREPILDKSLFDKVRIASGITPREQQITEPSNHDTRAVAADPLKLDDRAVALFTRWMKDCRTGISKRSLAKELGCHHSSLDDCSTFVSLWELSKREKLPGFRDTRTGKIEIEDDD